jgi:hypothetical protein
LVYKKTIIIIKSTDISLDRQTSSASVILFEKLPRDHQLSWSKLQNIIILIFIPYFIQVGCTLSYKQYEQNELVKKLKNKRFRPFRYFLPGVMFVTRGSKNSLFSVFDFLSNLDCGQWYKFWIYQSLPMSAPGTQSVDSRARSSFS